MQVIKLDTKHLSNGNGYGNGYGSGDGYGGNGNGYGNGSGDGYGDGNGDGAENELITYYKVSNVKINPNKLTSWK